MSEKFRKLAAQYHGGQWSALYAYSSSGTILPELAREIEHCFSIAPTKRQLNQLKAFYAFVAPAITVESVQSAHTFWHRKLRNADGSPLTVRRSGSTKLWKTRPQEFRVPGKYGLWGHVQITQENSFEWCIAH